MFSLDKNYFTDIALWAGSLSWCKFQQFFHNSSCSLLTRSRNFVETSMQYWWFTVWPLGTHSAITIYWMSKSTINMALKFKRLMHAFFVLGDVDFQYIDCRLVSRSYINIQVSLQVNTEFNKSGSFSTHCRRSKHNSLRRSFCSYDNTFGTIFAQSSSCSVPPLEIFEHFPCPNWLS